MGDISLYIIKNFKITEMIIWLEINFQDGKIIVAN